MLSLLQVSDCLGGRGGLASPPHCRLPPAGGHWDLGGGEEAGHHPAVSHRHANQGEFGAYPLAKRWVWSLPIG